MQVARMDQRAIEDGFPIEKLSEVAEMESYRKELNRPIYYLHKWWARRLGSVFRAAILGAALPPEVDIMEKFYESVDLDGLVVYDPFMGSGTTLGEAHKLGCTAVGQDINPVAYRAVKAALGPLDRKEVVQAFDRLKEQVGQELLSLYEGRDGEGNQCNVLYFFWVKTAPCPHCDKDVDLFKTYVFAKHTYPSKHPEVQVICPACDHVFESRYKVGHIICPLCKHGFDQDNGSARHTRATCTYCQQDFEIAKAASRGGTPPSHRLYAKLVLRSDGEKEYLPITDFDRKRYEEASKCLNQLDFQLAKVPIAEGHNTNQVLNYGYRFWDEFFNDRQLLGLTLLGKAIRDLPAGETRDAFACLFSGVLEFNNMFASYKGEGTGAVRHMFSHHILKPERTPLEANIWGTRKSSGAFSKLYKSRLLRAIKYREKPFEIAPDPMHNGRRRRSTKKYGISSTLGRPVKSFDAPFRQDGSIYLSCGNSANSNLPDKSVDLVVTDPPFFDNVHYSELADFFFVWQEQLFGNPPEDRVAITTRQDGEVQDVDAGAFAAKLEAVFADCCRVLRDDGLLMFSYHHSREEGWAAVSQAVSEAGFSFMQSQPVKSEMSVATPKSQAKSPIDIDVLLVCRKQAEDARPKLSASEVFDTAVRSAKGQIARFNLVGRELSKNDVRVVLASQLLVSLSAGREANALTTAVKELLSETQCVIEDLHSAQELGASALFSSGQGELFEAITD